MLEVVNSWFGMGIVILLPQVLPHPGDLFLHVVG